MARILVTPERLHDLSRQISQVANELRHLDGYLGRALGGLDWDAWQKAGAEGQVQAARGQARALAGQAEAMARFLTERAAAFQDADEEGTQALGAVVEAYLRPVPPPGPASSPSPTPEKVIDIYHQIRPIQRLGEVLGPIGAAMAIALSLKPGQAYAGEVVINLPDWLRQIKKLREIREAVGLPGHFNHFKVTNLPSHMLKWGVVLSTPDILFKWAKDVREYSGTKLVSAMVVDAPLTLAPVVVSSIIASAVVALSPVALPTTIVASNALVLGTAASIAADWALDHFLREKAIDMVDNALQPVAEGISKAFQKPELSFS